MTLRAIFSVLAIAFALSGAAASAQTAPNETAPNETAQNQAAPDGVDADAAVTGAPQWPDAPLEERILTGSAQNEVAITATFSGSELFVYGAIARNRFLGIGEGRPGIIIVVRGPSSPVMVRKKDRIGGLWMNNEAVRIAAAPSYYAVASTQPLDEMLDELDDFTYRISIDRAVLIAGVPFSAEDPASFREALIRLRRQNGLYRNSPFGVTLKGGTLYQARFRMPANIVEGDYQVRVFLVREGRVQDQARIELPVRKQGVERVLYAAAQETPFLYGVLTLLTALICGWGASELFRLLRR